MGLKDKGLRAVLAGPVALCETELGEEESHFSSSACPASIFCSPIPHHPSSLHLPGWLKSKGAHGSSHRLEKEPRLRKIPEDTLKSRNSMGHPQFQESWEGTTAYEMASIMSTPISTQQWAWSARASGSPDTQ